ncbi:hypothetical protein [Methylobacter psychrophilus]|uniref:hypothetical protein n=1 Tax=Methylobacter psychrophilus TaxID=96941 RepID=UPI0021D4B143|nr:hypothetical protein [Methylobacter psychrophilus]
MWFNPSELLIKEIIPPATFATSATLEVESSKVARVAAPLPVKTNNSDLESSRVARVAAPDNQTFVSCGKCLYFKCNNEHGRGAGSCNAGGDYGLWSESLHQCTKFDAVIEYKDYVVNDNALTVICFTPNGKPLKVQASSTEHAEYLQRMNSKPEEIKT